MRFPDPISLERYLNISCNINTNKKTGFFMYWYYIYYNILFLTLKIMHIDSMGNKQYNSHITSKLASSHCSSDPYLNCFLTWMVRIYLYIVQYRFCKVIAKGN